MKIKKLEQRKNIIRLHKKNKKAPEISYLLDVPRRTVSFWIKRFKETGSIKDKNHPGIKGKLTKTQLKELKQHLLNFAPKRYGGESLGWTTKTAIDFIKDKYGVKYSMRRMQELFHKFNLSLITPRSEYYSGSLLARNAFRSEFKKNSNQNIWIAKSLILTKQH